MNEPRDMFKAALDCIEFTHKVSSLMGHVRRIDESDLATVKRLVRERQELEKLIYGLGITQDSLDSPAKQLRDYLTTVA